MKTRAVLVALCLSRIAVAEEVVLDRTCVEIDSADALAEPERARALELLHRVLEREDLLVVTSACTETYTVSHERDGAAFVIRMRNAAGKRRMASPTLDELSAKYERLARALIAGKAAMQAPAAPEPQRVEDLEPQPAALEQMPAFAPLPTQESDRDVVPDESTAVKRNLWYALAGLQLTGGGGGSFGYRRAFESMTLDLAFNVRGSDGGTDSTTFSAELLHDAPLSPAVRGYIGGGLSLGSMSRGDQGFYYGNDHNYFWGEGAHAEATSGLRIGSARGTQALVQLDITLPFYRLGNDQGDHDYTPTAVLSGGLGF